MSSSLALDLLSEEDPAPDAIVDQASLEAEMQRSGLGAYLKRLGNLKDAERASRVGAIRGLLADALASYTSALSNEMGIRSRPGPPPTPIQALLQAQAKPHIVGYVALSRILDMAPAEPSLAAVTEEVGRAVYQELLTEQLATTDPRLWKTVQTRYALDTMDSAFRGQVLSEALDHSNAAPFRWSPQKQYQVGLYLTGLAIEGLGLLERIKLEVPSYERTHSRQYEQTHVRLCPEVLERIRQEDLEIGFAKPHWDPMIQPPEDWSTLTNGGYLNLRYPLLGTRRKEQELLEGLIRSGAVDLDFVLAAINRLQSVPWRVNGALLIVARHFLKRGIEGDSNVPPWPRDDSEPGLRDSEADTSKARRGLASRTIRQAEDFEGRAAIYYPVYLDYRGRIFLRPGPLSPQGTDLAKSLLTFEKPKPLGTVEAYRWFLRHGANVLGENRSDKLSADEQVELMESPAIHRRVWAIHANPIRSLELWRHAAAPWRFLAFALEYGRYLVEAALHEARPWLNFETALPISMDASCSGLQHLSLAVRDPIGAKATNLLPGPRQDLYAQVADRTVEIIEERLIDDAMAIRWLDSSLLDRSMVKPVVMAKPYGLTWPGSRNALQKTLQERYDSSNAKDAFPFQPDEFFKAATSLTSPVIEATDALVKAAPTVMRFLSRAARVPAKADIDIHWPTPSGFHVVQFDRKYDSVEIKTRLFGSIRYTVRMRVDTAEINVDGHAKKAPANWTHSQDAAHLVMTINALPAGIPLGCVHDCLQVRPSDAPEVYSIAREQLVRLYESDPLRVFYEYLRAKFGHQYFVNTEEHLPLEALPDYGDLDLEKVLEAEYIFS